MENKFNGVNVTIKKDEKNITLSSTVDENGVVKLVNSEYNEEIVLGNNENLSDVKNIVDRVLVVSKGYEIVKIDGIMFV